MTEIILRDYQLACIESAQAEWARGVNATFGHLATGTGKTEIALGLLAAELKAGRVGRVMFLVGMKKLVHQPVQRIDRHWPEFFGMTGKVQAENNDVQSRFIVATWQSLNEHRLADVLAFGPITHLIIDECHHSVTPGIHGVVKRLREVNPALRVFGITATPMRTDKVGLKGVFESVCFRYSIAQAIKDQWLSPFSALGISLDADISNVSQSKNGWNDDEIGEILSAENVMEIVLQNWRKFCEDRKTIAFVASVLQARRFAEYFNSHNVPAAMVCGETPDGERDHLENDFITGRINVLFNVMVLTEGVDIPAASAVMMIAPTKSDTIYIQRLGRGLRLCPGKSDCVVLDFAPVGGRNIVMAGDVLGVPKSVQKAQAKAEKQGLLFGFKFDELGESKTIDPAELIVHVMDLLGSHFLAWTADNRGAVAAIGDKDTGQVRDGQAVKVSVSMLIEFPDNPVQAAERIQKAEVLKAEGRWNQVWDAEYRKIAYKLWLVEGGRAEMVDCYPSIDAAQAQGDTIASTHYNAILGDKKREWRREPATANQVKFLEKLKVEIPPNCRKGQAAQLITGALAWKAVKQSRSYQQVMI